MRSSVPSLVTMDASRRSRRVNASERTLSSSSFSFSASASRPLWFSFLFSFSLFSASLGQQTPFYRRPQWGAAQDRLSGVDGVNPIDAPSLRGGVPMSCYDRLVSRENGTGRDPGRDGFFLKSL